MNLPRSTYYHPSKNHSGDDSELIARIEAIIEEFPGYGYRRVTYELHRRSIPANHKKVFAHHASTRATKKNQTPLDKNDG